MLNLLGWLNRTWGDPKWIENFKSIFISIIAAVLNGRIIQEVNIESAVIAARNVRTLLDKLADKI